jgi:hypothetical protein
MTGNDMMSIAMGMFWFVGIGMGFMFLYWLIVELPVYVRIKHQELYEKQKYPHTNGNK